MVEIWTHALCLQSWPLYLLDHRALPIIRVTSKIHLKDGQLTSKEVEGQVEVDLALGDDEDVVVGGQERPHLYEGDVAAGADVGGRLSLIVAPDARLVKWKSLKAMAITL